MVNKTINLAALEAVGVSQSDIARHLGLRASSVSMKVLGHRSWKQTEISRVLELVREKDPGLTYDRLFGDERHDKAA